MTVLLVPLSLYLSLQNVSNNLLCSDVLLTSDTFHTLHHVDATVHDQPSLSASPTSMSGIALCNKDQAEILAPALTDNDYHDSVLTDDSSLSVGTSLSGKGMTDAILKSTECYDIALVVASDVSLPGLSDVEKYCHLKNHFIPSSQDHMLSEVVKIGEKLRFQMKWLV